MDFDRIRKGKNTETVIRSKHGDFYRFEIKGFGRIPSIPDLGKPWKKAIRIIKFVLQGPKTNDHLQNFPRFPF